MSCRGCGEDLGESNDPREAYDIAAAVTGHDAGVVARGLLNRVRFDRANRGREG